MKVSFNNVELTTVNALQIYVCLLSMLLSAIMTARDGRVTRLEHVFLRGGQIKFIVVPDMLKNAPIFKKVLAMKSKAVDSANAKKPGVKKTGTK